jgi:hypothetical protein
MTQSMVIPDSVQNSVDAIFVTFLNRNCRTNEKNDSAIDTQHRNNTYANDITFNNFVPGALRFTAKEKKVFEIADQTTFPAAIKKFPNECLFQEMVREGNGHVQRLFDRLTCPEQTGQFREGVLENKLTREEPRIRCRTKMTSSMKQKAVGGEE